MFDNYYYISKDEIHIIMNDYGDYGSYSSSFRAICLGHNMYTGSRRGKIDNVTPIQETIIKNNKKIHFKIDSLNVIPHILAEKNMNNLTIKVSYYPIIMDPDILKLCLEGNY